MKAASIVVADDGGHLRWFKRLDGAAPISAQIAPGKARTAAIGRRDSALTIGATPTQGVMVELESAKP